MFIGVSHNHLPTFAFKILCMLLEMEILRAQLKYDFRRRVAVIHARLLCVPIEGHFTSPV